MVSGWAVFFVLATVYAGIVLYASRRTKPGGPVDVAGPLILLRTQRGIKGLRRMARHQTLWERVGNVFVVLTVLSGLAALALLIFQDIILLREFDTFRANPPGARDALAIPGVNRFIPIGYGLFALTIALVIHEGGHAILSLAQRLKVKSLGLLLFIVPVGAFVEPDEKELQASSLMAKLRMYAAGPGPNIVLATVCIILFAAVLMPTLQPVASGVFIENVTVGSPAHDGGLVPGMIVTAIDDMPTPTYEAFYDVLNATSANVPVSFDVIDAQGASQRLTIIPSDRGQYARSELPEAFYRPWCDGKAFLGVGFSGPDYPPNGPMAIADSLAHPFSDGAVPLPDTVALGCRVFETQSPTVLQGVFLYLALPFLGMSPFPDSVQLALEPTGWAAGLGDAFWVIGDGLFWLFWINVLLGTFNALPMGPLDGGHMFRQSVHTWLLRRNGVPDEGWRVAGGDGEAVRMEATEPRYEAGLERANRGTSVANQIVGWTLLALVLAPLILPRIL